MHILTTNCVRCFTIGLGIQLSYGAVNDSAANPASGYRSIRGAIGYDPFGIAQKEYGVALAVSSNSSYQISVEFLGMDNQKLPIDDDLFRRLYVYEPIGGNSEPSTRWRFKASVFSDRNDPPLTIRAPTEGLLLFSSWHSILDRPARTTFKSLQANDATEFDSWTVRPIGEKGQRGFCVEFNYKLPKGAVSTLPPLKKDRYPDKGLPLTIGAGRTIVTLLEAPIPAKLVHSPARNVQINELMSTNSTTIADESGRFSDWVELINVSSQPVDVAGLILSDRQGETEQWKIPEGKRTETTIAPGGVLLVWCDGRASQGVLHASFKLSSFGEELYLLDRDGKTILDAVAFPRLLANQSYGRDRGKLGSWKIQDRPSPGTP